MNRAANFPPSGNPDILEFKNGDTDLQPNLGFSDGATLPGCDEFDQQVANAQAQLEDLRQRQEKIERQKDELELLREKQTHFQCERAEILGNLQQVLQRSY